MNILILTPITPMQIAEDIDFIRKYRSDDNECFSIQSAALLAEETSAREKPYLAQNYIFTLEILKNPELMTKTNAKNLIIYGNLDKRTKIKFDHIFAMTNHYGETEEETSFDKYLEEADKKFAPLLKERDIPQIEWYTLENAEHLFPTWNHLGKMFEVIGVKRNEQSDSVQSEPTISN